MLSTSVFSFYNTSHNRALLLSDCNFKKIYCSNKFKTMYHMYTNQEANPYQPIFVTLYQMSVALSGSSTDIPVYIKNLKITTIDLVRRVQL